MSDGKSCCCVCHMMKGVLIILFGLTFLLGAFDVLSQRLVSIIWPILVMVAGAGSLMKGKCKCCGAAGCDSSGKLENKKS